jgi:hypothetical protein
MKCKTAILLVTLAVLALGTSTSISLAQNAQVGVYITVKYKKKCAHQVLNLDKKKFCLADQPVLTADDLSYISTIKIDLANQSYFSLVFTEDGVKKLKNLSIAFPNTQIALVVDKTIVGFLTNLETLRSNSLKMTAGTGSPESVEFVHEKLRAVLPVKN